MLQILLALAVIVERLTEYVFGTLFDKITALEQFRWTIKYLALCLGVFVALSFKIDLLTLIELEPSTLGMVLTGIAVGGGSNLLHEVISGIGKQG